MEFDDQQAVGFAEQHLVDRGSVDRDTAAEVDHGAIDQFHCLRLQRDDVTGRFHRLAERRELADAQHFARLDRMQRQFDCGGKCQRALGPDQQPGQVVAARSAGGGRQRIDVIAADAAKLLRKAGGDFLGLGGTQAAQALDQVHDRGRDLLTEIIRNVPKRCWEPSDRIASIARTLSAISP